MMSEGLAECEWISGILELAVYQDYETLITSSEVFVIARRARHEGGQPFAD